MEISPMGAELFYADGRTERQTRDECGILFAQFCERS